MAAILDSYCSGSLGGERNLYQGGKGWSKGKRGEGVGGWVFSHLLPTVLSNSLSNMAGRVNDREPVTVTRPNKTAELQVNPLHLTSVCIFSILFSTRFLNC